MIPDCGRYAPNPSGPLHLGNLRTALLAWLQARLAGGSFIMRIDDLDLARRQAGATRQLMKDIAWLGLDWDQGPDTGGDHAPYYQSQRSDLYDSAFEHLVEQGLVYGCSCSRKDIAEAADAPHQPGRMLRYPGTCRSQSIQPADDNLASYAWRLRTKNQLIEFDDKIYGRYSQNLSAETGDFVIRRRDGVSAYQLASVVDDAQMEVTTVLRGADLLDSTPRQIALIDALGYNQPQYWHVPLMLDENGQRMAKRDHSTSLLSLIEKGANAEQVVGELAFSCALIEQPVALSALELLQQLTLNLLRKALRRASKEDVK